MEGRARSWAADEQPVPDEEAEEDGKVGEREEKEPARSRVPRGGPEEGSRPPQEARADSERGRTVPRAREAEERREHAHDRQRGRSGERPERDLAARLVAHREHREVHGGIVAPVGPGDRHEVRDLPEEEDAEEDPAQGRNRALGGGPAYQRRERPRDRAYLGAPQAPALRRRVPAQVECDRQEREEGGEPADLREYQHQSRDAHEPPEDEGRAPGDPARRDRPQRRAPHPRVRVALHPLVERGDAARGKRGSHDEEPDTE